MNVSEIRILKISASICIWIIQTNQSYTNESYYYTCNSIIGNVLFAISLTSGLLVFNSHYALNRGEGNNLYDITIHESIFLQKEN